MTVDRPEVGVCARGSWEGHVVLIRGFPKIRDRIVTTKLLLAIE